MRQLFDRLMFRLGYVPIANVALTHREAAFIEAVSKNLSSALVYGNQDLEPEWA